MFMFILLGVYLGGLLVSYIASAKVAIADDDCDLCECEGKMIIASLLWPIMDTIWYISIVRDALQKEN